MPNIHAFIACLYAACLLTGCNQATSDDWKVEPSVVTRGDTAEIYISDKSLYPVVTRNVGCGDEAVEVNEDYRMLVRQSGDEGEWQPLLDVYWDWDEDRLHGVLPSALSSQLIGPVDLEIFTPTDDEPLRKSAAFQVVAASGDSDSGSEFESDSDSQVDTVEDSASATDSISDMDSGTETDTNTGTGADTGTGTASDYETDTGIDTVTDYVTDTVTETFTDYETDTGVDTWIIDSGTVMGTDTEADTGTDSDADTGTETETDMGTDTVTDTVTETDTDTGTDTETDTGTDTETDTGTDTGTDTETDSLPVEVPALLDVPVIDGIIEDGLELAYVTPVAWQLETEPIPDGNEMYYAIAWYNTGVYFFIDVIDPNRNPPALGSFLYMGDSVEIYVDHDGVYNTALPDYDDPGTREFIISAPYNDTTPSTRGVIRSPLGDVESYSNITGDQWISTPTATGYVIEIFVIAENLNLATLDFIAGDTISFDLSHNVSVAPGETGLDGNRLSQYYLKIRDPAEGDNNDYPWRNQAVFCPATLMP